MKRVIQESIWNIILYASLAYFLAGLFYLFLATNDTITATALEMQAPTFSENELIIPLFPIAQLLIVLALWTFFSYRNRPKNAKTFWKWATTMTEFSEEDEREQEITQKATRAAYYGASAIFPGIALILTLVYPFVMTTFPTLPIYAVMLGLVLTSLTYAFAWVRAYKS